MDEFVKKTLYSIRKSIYFLLILYITYIFVAKKGVVSIILWSFFVIILIDVLPLLVEHGKRYIKTLVTISILFSLIYYLGQYGFIGGLLIVLLIVVYKLITGRKQYMASIRHIETKIWGKPLDKKEWKDERNDT